MTLKIAAFTLLFLLGAGGVFSQDETAQQRFIPEELLRPRRDEAPRYPVDTVIGPLGRGEASSEAYEFARNIASAFLAGTMEAPMLSVINPRFFRLGGGREEPDGSISFMIRFVGREQGITGELFIRLEEIRPSLPPPRINVEENGEDEVTIQPSNIPIERKWVFEDLLLEEPRTREAENQESRHRYDFPPYERFF